MKLARRRYGLLIGLTLLCGMLFFASLVIAFSGNDAMISPTSMWTPVFTDTFDVLLPVWTHIDNVNGNYRWGVTPYTRSLGTLEVTDHGLWSAGGGTVGGAQSWPTGTYVNNMTVWAIAGPFTPTQRVWEMRLQIDVQNRVAAGDTLFIGLSNGPLNPYKGVEVSESFSEWRSISWSTQEFGQSPVWIALLFTSDGQSVDAGSLVDNLVLEFNYGATVYLPVVRRDPTPTPTPTPTPLPIYVDHFDNPASGWHTGEAIRFNEWCRDGICYARDEVVAYISYIPGHYRYWIPLSWHGGIGDVDTWFVWPAERAPMPDSYYPLPERYCVEARGKFANARRDYDPWWAHWGIVFGANADMTDLYTFEINANHNYGAQRFYNYVYPGDVQREQPINIATNIIPWCKTAEDYPCDFPFISTMDYNVVKAAVRGNVVDVYVNGHWMARGNIPNMPRHNVGLFGGTWEYTPVELWFDYFRYDPFCPEAQQ